MRQFFAVVVFVLLIAPSARALTADQLLLVVNRNQPAGVELATHYARQRNVPPAQIIQLDLPNADDISPDEYEQRIAEPIAAFLRQPANAGKIRCVVTFYGVPFRIAPRPKGEETIAAELRVIAEHRRHIEPILAEFANRAEEMARELDASYQPPRSPEGEAPTPSQRMVLAANLANGRTRAIADADARKKAISKWNELWGEVSKAVEIADEPATAGDNLPLAADSLNLGSRSARQALRAEARKLGPLRYEQILEIQASFLSFDQTDAAVDSELATVLWGAHGRPKWLDNLLQYPQRENAARAADPRAAASLMVMRLDGPTPEVVRRIIDDSIAVEKAGGPAGSFVIDSWNKPHKKPDGTADGYGAYDESLRRLNALLSPLSQLPIQFDASESLVAPGASDDPIALYCGWYDPNTVTLPGKFARGAVGFHIASYTAVGLHGQGGGWWTPALLDAGVVATLGPVSEPYLHAFPLADDFFPLLLTGKLTLAEVYWTSVPMTSWKMLAIGDPLYTPFRDAPKLGVNQLPPRLRTVFKATAP